MSITSHQSNFQPKNLVKLVCSTQRYKDLWDMGLCFVKVVKAHVHQKTLWGRHLQAGAHLGVRGSYEEEYLDSRLQLSSQRCPSSVKFWFCLVEIKAL